MDKYNLKINIQSIQCAKYFCEFNITSNLMFALKFLKINGFMNKRQQA